MDTKDRVQQMLDEYDVEELLDNGELDLTPFVDFGLEALGATGEYDKDDWLDSIVETMESLEIEEDDQLVLWNRAAFLFFAELIPDGGVDGLEGLYGGTEGNILLLSAMSFIEKMEERDEPDWSCLIRWHLFLRDLLEDCWAANGSPDYATEMLWQALEAVKIYYSASQFDDAYRTAVNAILLSDDIEESADGMDEALGLLFFYAAETGDDEKQSESFRKNAWELLDDPEVLADPVDGETKEIAEDLRRTFQKKKKK